MLSETQTEAALVKGMKRMAVPFQTALDVLKKQCTLENPDLQMVTARLQVSMQMIAEYELVLSPLREQWNGLQKTPHSELTQLIEQHSRQLQELLELLDRMAQQISTSRNQLASRLDAAQRRTAMRQAYCP